MTKVSAVCWEIGVSKNSIKTKGAKKSSDQRPTHKDNTLCCAICCKHDVKLYYNNRLLATRGINVSVWCKGT